MGSDKTTEEQTLTDFPRLQVNQENASPVLEPLELGKRIKDIRLRNDMTLEEVSRRTGVARSTLSKIENEQISPTFGIIQKLAHGLEIDIPQLFVTPTSQPPKPTGRRTITRAGEGVPHPTVTYEHELLCDDLTGKRMVPFKTIVRARSFDDFPDWVRHDGEEFLLVLDGAVTLYTEMYGPVTLNQGDSVYYDCTMGHAVVSVSEEDATILWMTAP